MKSFTVGVGIILSALAFLPAAAQTYHWDFRPPIINDTTWWSIIGDHDSDDGHCDNTNGSLEGFPDVDCGQWNDAPQAPIAEASQDCGTGSCTVSATVRCSWMNPPVNPAPPEALYTFTCTGPATGPQLARKASGAGRSNVGVR